MKIEDVRASYEPGDAVHRLDVSASGLWRLAAAYEEVHCGPPHKVSTKARLYSKTVLEQITQARLLVKAGRYTSNTEALDALRRDLEPDKPAELTPQTDQAAPWALARFIEEQRSILSRIEATLTRLGVLRRAQLIELDTTTTPECEHGLVVRAALWLEGLLRGGR